MSTKTTTILRRVFFCDKLFKTLNSPDTVENKARGALGLVQALTGSERLSESLTGPLVKLTDTETQTQPASLALLLPGEDEALGLPTDTAQLSRARLTGLLLEESPAGLAHESSEIFRFSDVTAVFPVTTNSTNDVSLKLSSSDFACFLHQSTANRVGRALFTILYNSRELSRASVVLLNLLTKFDQTSLLQFVK